MVMEMHDSRGSIKRRQQIATFKFHYLHKIRVRSPARPLPQFLRSQEGHGDLLGADPVQFPLDHSSQSGDYALTERQQPAINILMN